MRFWQKALGGKGLMRLEALQYKSLLVCMDYSPSACVVKMTGYWPSFFCVFMDRGEVEVHKLGKNERGQYPAIVMGSCRTANLVNKGYVIWLSLQFFLRDKAGSPERARWLHLARSGSQSYLAIWFMLPARGACHIIGSLSRDVFEPRTLTGSLSSCF